MDNLQKKLKADTLLLGELRMGSKRAFAQIYKLHRLKIYSIIRKQINDNSIAEELMQDVFIIIWEKKSKLDLEKCFDAYLSCIANSRVVDFYRKAKNRIKILTANSVLLGNGELGKQ